MLRFYLLVMTSLFLISPIFAQNGKLNLLSEKERSAVIDEILEDRIDNLLPQLMERENIDMWILISREYNEDPVMKTMLPSTWLSARRRTILVFNRKEIEELKNKYDDDEQYV